MDARKEYRCEEFMSNAEYIAKKLMVPKDKQVAAVLAVPT